MNRLHCKILILLFTGVFSLTYAASFSKAAKTEPFLVQEDKGRFWCPVSGLELKGHYGTNHISKLPSGTKRQYASLSCLAIDMEEYGIDISYVKAVDAKTQKLIDAVKAFYLVDSKIKGVMSRKSKLAFEKEADAKEFQKKYRGMIVDFKTALKICRDELKGDKNFISKKHKKRDYPMGKKIFKLKCDKNIDPTEYIEINEFKGALKFEKLCKPLNEKRLHSVALYLWDVKRFGDLDEISNKVKVEKHEKCPVCGMFTYKYPRWAAQIFYEQKGEKKHWSFDGVKDLIKFYFDPMKWGDYPIAKRENITKILVTDYYSQEAIDGTKAYYVIRSDVYGPMGHEFIPFASKQDAKTFMKDHFGKKILKFKDITENKAYELDYNE